MFVSKATLFALIPFFLEVSSQASGTGKSTRYWDCCKPSCAWSKKVALASGAHAVNTCDRNDNFISDVDAKSGCDGGGAYMCTNQMPWQVSPDLAYGFAAVSIQGGNEASWCCACYELTFTSGPSSGKKMIIQATNTGGDLGNNHFDIAMPGGGFGIFNGCTNQWNSPSTNWGQQYGGVSSTSQCDTFPEKLKPGCKWRFDWFQNNDNPSLNFKQVTCPKALTDKTGCIRAGEIPTGELPSTLSTTRSSTSTQVVVPTTTSIVPTTSALRTTSTVRYVTTTTITSTLIVAPTTSRAPVPGGSSTSIPVPELPAQRWAQCGGTGYTGPTTCAVPWKCVFTNQFYSQCL